MVESKRRLTAFGVVGCCLCLVGAVVLASARQETPGDSRGGDNDPAPSDVSQTAVVWVVNQGGAWLPTATVSYLNNGQMVPANRLVDRTNIIYNAPQKLTFEVNHGGVVAGTSVALPSGSAISTVYAVVNGRTVDAKAVAGRQLIDKGTTVDPLPVLVLGQETLRGAQSVYAPRAGAIQASGNRTIQGGDSDCCIANGTPGCDDPACEATVCAADAFCCDTSWDSICAGEAEDLCGDLCSGGGGGPSDCCIANGTPGCDDPACEAAVCAVDAFCCDTSWDAICAGEAADLCGDLCGGGGGGLCPPGAAGDCCSANGTPGCDDPTCCDAVCAIDAFCCDTSWDGICAGEAGDVCEACGGGPVEPCDVECPAGGLTEGEACGADTNGGCNSAPPAFEDAACDDTWCGESFAAGGTRDTDWYLVKHPGGTLSAQLNSAFPGTLFIVDGIGACAPVVVGTIGCSDACGGPIQNASADLPAGQYVVFVAPGDCAGAGVFEGFPCGSGNNSYSVSIDCAGGCASDDECPPGQTCNGGVCTLPPPANDDCEDAVALAVPSDTNGTTVQATVDSVPGGTCGTSVDSPGVWYSVIGTGTTLTASTCNQANYDTKISVFCNGCGEGGGAASNCCSANGGLGCDDPACEAAVCGIDAFCCETAWDGICAGEAADLCEVCMAAPGSALTCVGGLDDTAGCAGFTTSFSWCGNPGVEYLVLIHGFGGASGDFTLSMTSGAACATADGCVAGCETDADCPAGFFCDGGSCAPLPTGACCTCDGSDSLCAISTESDCAAAGGTYLGNDSTCESAGEIVTVGSSPNASIPDNNAAGVSDTIAMGMSFNVSDLDVAVNINHTWVGDLCVTLSHDGGTPVELIRRPGLEPDACGPGVCCGCNADNYSGTVLDDEGGDGAVEGSCTPGNPGSLTPNNPLSAFDGADSAGNWTLNVSDGAGADTGSLVSWSLIFTQPAAGGSPCEVQAPCTCESDADCNMGQVCVDGVCENTGACCVCTGSRCDGTLGTDCSASTEAACAAQGGSYRGDGSLCDGDGDGIIDGCEGECTECNDNADCDSGICLPDGTCSRQLPGDDDDDDDGGLPGDDDDDNG